ncbi:hypothetical protein SCHPADRAFT_354512 [Schizopora paradoxa]|uniref:Uncharacterized protein n=1 Tax=Schizopora paradoxa TaxID=27342 RepID=A0A0H2RNL0_9AGAM|nr:hypothetical protein SCHPADRAFT_354512 [Schizopora paradoxa]
MKYGSTSAPIQLARAKAMSSVKPWRPDEPAATIHAEGAWLQGAFISKIFYGFIVVLSWQCFALLRKQTNRSNYKTKISFLAIVFAIFLFTTLHTAYDMKEIQLGFVENRNFPGGPNAYATLSHANTPGNIACIILQWLCDALLIWRFVMIFRGCFIPMWLIAATPIIAYFGSVVIGILFTINQLNSGSPLVRNGVDWTMPYFAVSLGLNVLLTIGIVARLLLYRHRITSVFGAAHGSHYTSIVSIIVESAALYSTFSILFIIPFALNSVITPATLQPIGQVQGFATLLIVHRVASGIAWSSDTQSLLTTRKELGGIQPPRFIPPSSVSITNTVGGSEENRSQYVDERGSIIVGVGIMKVVETDTFSIPESSDIASHGNMYDGV